MGKLLSLMMLDGDLVYRWCRFEERYVDLSNVEYRMVCVGLCDASTTCRHLVYVCAPRAATYSNFGVFFIDSFRKACEKILELKIIDLGLANLKQNFLNQRIPFPFLYFFTAWITCILTSLNVQYRPHQKLLLYESLSPLCLLKAADLLHQDNTLSYEY